MAYTYTSPTAGRVYVGKIINITWEDDSAGGTGTRTIDISLNNGSSWTTLGTKPYSAGTNIYTWVPTSGQISNAVKIRIVRSGAPTTIESGVFEVLNPTLTLLGPNGPLTGILEGGFRSGNLVNIVWDSTSAHVTTVNVQYTLNGSAGSPTWSNIAAGVANSGNYVWVPGDPPSSLTTDNTDVRVRVVSAESGDDNNWSANSVSFRVSNGPIDLNLSVQAQLDYPEDLAFAGPIKAAKGIDVEDVIVKGQIEQGTGISIYHRGYGDPTKENNIVISTSRPLGRRIAGQITCDILVPGGWNVSDTPESKYGNLMYKDIVHNWGLSDIDRYELHLFNIGTGEAEIVPTFRAIDSNTIRVYALDKGTPTTAPKPAPLQDDVPASALTGVVLTFKYVLVEVVL